MKALSVWCCFQEHKELGSWFGKLLPITSSMVNCQPQQTTETGRKAPKTNGEEANPEENHDDDRKVTVLSEGPLMGHQMLKGNMYLHQRVEKI